METPRGSKYAYLGVPFETLSSVILSLSTKYQIPINHLRHGNEFDDHLSILPTIPRRAIILTRVTLERMYYRTIDPARLVSTAATFIGNHTDAQMSDLERTLRRVFDLTVDEHYSCDSAEWSRARAYLFVIAVTRRHQPAPPGWHPDGSPVATYRYHRYVRVMLEPQTLILEDNRTVRALASNR